MLAGVCRTFPCTASSAVVSVMYRGALSRCAVGRDYCGRHILRLSTVGSTHGTWPVPCDTPDPGAGT